MVAAVLRLFTEVVISALKVPGVVEVEAVARSTIIVRVWELPPPKEDSVGSSKVPTCNSPRMLTVGSFGSSLILLPIKVAPVTMLTKSDLILFPAPKNVEVAAVRLISKAPVTVDVMGNAYNSSSASTPISNDPVDVAVAGANAAGLPQLTTLPALIRIVLSNPGIPLVE